MARTSAKQAQAAAAKEAAELWLADRAYDYLLTTTEPVKTGEILRGIALEGISLRLVRHALAGNPRFQQFERKWTLSERFQDTTRPVETVINAILQSSGRPVSVDQMAHELAVIYGRPAESLEPIAARMLSNRGQYFEAGDGRFGLASWLVHPTSESEDDVLFDNFLEPEDVAPYRSAAKKAFGGVGVAEACESLLTAVGTPIPIKCVLFFAWQSDPYGYRPAAAYSALLGDEKLILLSDQRLCLASEVGVFLETLAQIADTLQEAEEEAEEVEEPAKLEIAEAEKEEAVKIILSSGGVVNAEDIIEPVLEISPGERSFEPALDQLITVLKGDSRIAWVGWGQWMPADDVPAYAYEVPAVLEIPPVHPLETAEGEVHDLILEDEGLAGPLKKEIFNPLAMDVTDDDAPDIDRGPVPQRQRCVLTYHHKMAGTFPLCQIHPAFFPPEPDILRIMIVDEAVRREAWVSRETGIIYGMSDWYQEMPISGGVFYLEPAVRDGEFRYIHEGETDPLVYIPDGRLLELLGIKDDPQINEISTFELITRIMAGQRNSAEFITLLTEVNLVRRVPRRLVASILSSYHCFDQKAKTDIWRFDEKKVSQGFNKNKRKYVRKDQI